MKCSHCERHVPLDVVGAFDGSGCPLVPPCAGKGLQAADAWPLPDADDDDDGGEAELAGPPDDHAEQQ
jgi:hypothetical protein